MTTEDERLDLLTNLLLTDANNFVACPVDMVLQNIVFLQEQIESGQSHLKYLQSQLEQLKGRVIAEDIKESGDYYAIEIPGKKMRNPITDIEKFRQMFRESYAMIRDAQKRDIAFKYNDALSVIDIMPIPLGLADDMIGKERVTEFVGYAPQKVTIEVRERKRLQK